MATAATFLTATWRALVMASWPVDPDALAPLLPAGTQLDRFGGLALASLVGFRFLDTRVLGVRVPFHADFDEVNLRVYVRRDAGCETRRGVVFVREIVPRRAIAWIANACYGERYVALPMRHAVELPGAVRYEWRHRGRWNRLAARVDGEPRLPDPGSEEEFITEHYWGYAAQRDGTTVEYRVDHPRWRVWQGRDATIDVDVEALYGAAFARSLRGPPTSLLVADGSEVVVRRGERVPAGRVTAP